MSVPEYPINDTERYLAAIARGDREGIPEYPETRIEQYLEAITNNNIASGIQYTTTAPTTANTDGLKFVVLSAEPATRYDGYLYIITE